MKKIIIVLFLFAVIALTCTNNEEYLIPDSAIRFRVIANSNTLEDQAAKMEIKNNIENLIKKDLLNTKNKETAKTIIQNKIPEIKNLLNTYNYSYNLNYGKNYFPEKSYKGVKYQEGEYESLVVTLGKGNGENWWCVLFPPLCFTDLDENTTKDVEYSFFVKEMFKNYM